MNINLVTPKSKNEQSSSFSKSPMEEGEKSPHYNPNETEMQRMIRKNKIARGWSDVVGTPDFDREPNPKTL